jgi:hypothetical protein
MFFCRLPPVDKERYDFLHISDKESLTLLIGLNDITRNKEILEGGYS